MSEAEVESEAVASETPDGAAFELTEAAQVQLSASEQARAAHADDEAPAFEPPPGIAAQRLTGPRPVMTAKAAVDWFLRDMAEVSGFVLAGFKQLQALSVYATYRPMLTKPDPWYFAGVVAMEASPIIGVYPTEIADDLLREIMAQMDAVIGRDDDEASSLTLMLLGRLGLGSMLMGPENNVKKIMPDPKAHDQLRAALKSGKPVWWKMFSRRYKLVGEDKTAVLPKPRANPNAAPVSLAEARARRDALREALAAADIPVPAAMGGKTADSPEGGDAQTPEHDDSFDDVLEAPLELKAETA